MLRSISTSTTIVLLWQQRRGLSGLFALVGASKKNRFSRLAALHTGQLLLDFRDTTISRCYN
jgi:hypothetical protein